MDSEEFKSLLAARLKQYGWSVAEFSKKSGLPIGTIYGLRRNKNLPEHEALEKIYAAFNLTEQEFQEPLDKIIHLSKREEALVIHYRQMQPEVREGFESMAEAIANSIS